MRSNYTIIQPLKLSGLCTLCTINKGVTYDNETGTGTWNCECNFGNILRTGIFFIIVGWTFANSSILECLHYYFGVVYSYFDYFNSILWNF